MFSRILKKTKQKKIKHYEVKVCESVKDYSNEEYFVRKAEAAKKVLSQSVFPKELTTA